MTADASDSQPSRKLAGGSGLALRPYQRTAVAAVQRHLATERTDGVVSMPTGSGKTIVFAELIRDWFDRWGDQGIRVLILAHRYELLQQAEDKLRRVWPDAPVGVWSAGLGRREGDRSIVVAGIQSVHDKASSLAPVNAVLIDEAHLLPNDSDTMYRRLLDGLRALHGRMRVIGFTATPFRLDGGRIYGRHRLFKSLIYEAPVAGLIEDGWLCPLTTSAAAAELDTAGVRSRGGDFVRGELERAVDTEDLVRCAVAELVQRTHDRGTILVFASGVDHARHVAEEIQRHGHEAQVVVGETPRDQRAEHLARFEAGDLRYLVNVECLTTGLDVERIDSIACLRPTQSTALWVQMVGRGLRKHPDKADTLVLDFGGNVLRHGPLDCLDPLIVRKGKGASTARLGDGQSGREVRHAAHASAAEVIGQERTRHRVLEVHVDTHEKPGKPPSLRVSYRTPEGWFSEWICLQHAGFAGQKARRWWGKRFGYPTPKTVEAAMAVPRLAECIAAVTAAIRIDRSERFAQIVGHTLRPEAVHA